MRMNEYVILSLGSNIGSREKYLSKAIEEIKKFVEIEKISRIYETSPVGVENQDKFLNLVVIGDTKLSPHELLLKLKETEKRVGRKERFRWGPREIDIDIVYFKSEVIKEGDLVIPHPERLNRNFVIIPILELLPNFVDVQTQMPLREFLKQNQEVSVFI